MTAWRHPRLELPSELVESDKTLLENLLLQTLQFKGRIIYFTDKKIRFINEQDLNE